MTRARSRKLHKPHGVHVHVDRLVHGVDLTSRYTSRRLPTYMMKRKAKK